MRTFKTGLFTADDRLSRMASEVWAAQRGLSEGASDLALFGAPSECMDIIRNAANRRLRRRAAELGYTPESFDAALSARISDKAAYNLGLGFTEEGL